LTTETYGNIYRNNQYLISLIY